MMKRTLSQKFLASALVLGLALTCVQAEPFVDEFHTLDYVHNDSGTCIIVQEGDGRLLVTNDVSKSPRGIFGWSNKGFTAISTLSTLPEDGQSVLLLEGIEAVKDADVEAKLYAVPFFGDGTDQLAPYKDGNSAYFIPVEPDEKGTWRLDIGKFIEENLAEQPKQWAVQFVLDTEDNPRLGYKFSSISAVRAE